MDVLSRELQHLLDRQAIMDCLTRFARGLDRHDEALFTSAFHSEAITNHGDFYGSPSEFFEYATDVLTTDMTSHLNFITNVTVEIEADIAHCESYVLFTSRRRDGSGIDLAGGRYIDRFERRDRVWRIAAREMILEWFRQAPGAVFDETDAYLPGTWDRSDPSYKRPFDIVVPDSAFVVPPHSDAQSQVERFDANGGSH